MTEAESSAGHGRHLRPAGRPFLLRFTGVTKQTSSGQLPKRCFILKRFIFYSREVCLTRRCPMSISGRCCWQNILLFRGVQSSWFRVCAYLMKFNETVLCLGSGQDHLCGVQSYEQIQSCFSQGHDQSKFFRLISFHFLLMYC